MILITGAGGTVGSAVVDELKRSGQQLRLAFHSPDKAARAAAAGYEVAAIDYTQPASLGPALEGVDTMFLLSNGFLDQAEGEINLVRAAQQAGAERIVKLSVWGAEDESFLLAALHRRVERVIEASGLVWTFLRPNSFMQGFLTVDAPTIRSEGAIYAPAGAAPVSHVDVRDIARVAALALTERSHAGKAYALSGPRALSYAEVAAILSETLGRLVRYVAISDDELRSTIIADGAPGPYADYLVDIYRYFRTGGAAGVNSTVQELTGREAIPFEQFARDYAAVFA